MNAKWSHFDALSMPLVITDQKGIILYKNKMADKIDIMRRGSSLLSSMDYISKLNFKALEKKGDLLQILVMPYAHRCIAIPFSAEHEHYVGFLFPSALIGDGYNRDNEELMLKLVPSLRKMLIETTELSYLLGRSTSKKAAGTRLSLLLRKMMIVYLDGRRKEEELQAVEIDYFLSVLSYFVREVFKYQGVKLAISETAAEGEFEFLDHRNVVAMLLSMIELIIDRSGTDRIYIDIYSEAGQAVIMFSAVLRGEWTMPDDSLPDSFILFSVLRNQGIEYEFYNTVSEDSPRMICRLFMPHRIARPLVRLRCGKAVDSRLALNDFLEYLYT